jgi:hypothetical protein
MERQLDRQRELETQLAAERQGRLNVSDKLNEASKVGDPPIRCRLMYADISDGEEVRT